MYPSHLGTSYKIPLQQNVGVSHAQLYRVQFRYTNPIRQANLKLRLVDFQISVPYMRAAFISILDAIGPTSVIIMMMDVRWNICASSTPFFDGSHSHYVITIHLCHLQANCGQI